MRTFTDKPKGHQQTICGKPTKLGDVRFGQSADAVPILRLQRMIGNQAILRLSEANNEGHMSDGSSATGNARIGQNFSQIPIHRKAPAASQTKLEVSIPDDAYEQEADRVAQQVLHMPEPWLQRSCPCGDGCPKCMTEQSGQQHERLQTLRVGSSDLGQADVPPSVHDMLRLPGQPLDHTLRAFMESRMGYDFSRVRVHPDQRSASALRAQAYTVGPHIAFAPGRYRPDTVEGKRLMAHEITHVIQQGAAGGTQAGTVAVQRTPETWYRGEAEGVAPARPGSVIHDFGDGLYLTDDPAMAAEYANLRAGENPAAGRVVAATFERTLLGRVLNLSTDPRWAAYMRETTPSGITYEQLIRMANENYWKFFQEFLRRHGLALENFDTIIGPEYVRSGTQICIRNPDIAAKVRGMLGIPKTGGGPAEAPAEYPVESRFRVLNTEEIPGGQVVSDVEVVLGDGLEAMNGRVTASGARPLPARFTLRITTDAKGALAAVEASSSEAAAMAEPLARHALATAPRAGATAAGTGAAGAARAVSPWVRGASWAGLALFAAITVYRYSTAAPEDRPRELARAAGGFTAGMVGGYVICNLVLGLETLGWSLLICGAVVGVPAGMAGEAIADVAYDEATIDDDEIRAWVASHDLADIGRLPSREKLRLIFSLMHGWVSDEDIATIERILASVGSAAEMVALRRAIEPHITELTSIGQRTRLRVALVRRP
jgi:hypothetical protein